MSRNVVLDGTVFRSRCFKQSRSFKPSPSFVQAQEKSLSLSQSDSLVEIFSLIRLSRTKLRKNLPQMVKIFRFAERVSSNRCLVSRGPTIERGPTFAVVCPISKSATLPVCQTATRFVTPCAALSGKLVSISAHPRASTDSLDMFGNILQVCSVTRVYCIILKSH